MHMVWYGDKVNMQIQTIFTKQEACFFVVVFFVLCCMYMCLSVFFIFQPEALYIIQVSNAGHQ